MNVDPPPAGAAEATIGRDQGAARMQINLIYDSFAQAAPQSFRDGMQAAANVLDAAFDDNITVNISVGYGELNGVPLGGQNISTGSPVESLVAYSTLRSDL